MSAVVDALRRAVPRLLLLCFLVGGLTYAVASLMAPRYQSEAELAIVARGASGSFSDARNQGSGPDLITTRMDKEAINTHVRAMQSTDLLEKIATDLKLEERPEFNSALGPVDTIDSLLRMIGIGAPRSGETARDRVLNALRERLEIYTAKESRFIGVRMTATDPEIAARIANALAESYRASLAKQGVAEVDDLQGVLTSKIGKLASEVAAAETAVDRFRGKIDGFRGGAQNTGLNEQQMSELTAELTKTKAARGEAEARAASAREMMTNGSADALPDVQKSPLIQNLVQQRVGIERQISELSATLLSGHPRMRQLKADLAGLNVQVRNEVSKIVDSLDKEAKVARGREASIEQSLADIKARVVSNAPEEAQLRQLETTAKAKRAELENLQGQLEANRKKLDARAQPVEAQIISNAQAESVPVFPKKGRMAALAAAAALMFGVAWTVTKALFVEARRAESGQNPRRKKLPRARAGAETRRVRTEPVLDEGIVAASEPDLPLLPEAEAAVVSEPAMEPQPEAEPVAVIPVPIIEAADVTTVASLLIERRPESGGYRTIITGATEAIDPSKDAIALAKAMAQAGGQVILLDWSPAGEGIVEVSGPGSGPGINDLMRGEVSFEAIIQRLTGTSVHAIATGTALGADFGALASEQMNLVLDALDEAYDHIIVVGRHRGEARRLFEVIEGRFDAGVTVLGNAGEATVDGTASAGLADVRVPGTFLGFDVQGIELIDLAGANEEVAKDRSRIDRIMRPRGDDIARSA
ncbi:GumC family protein [Hyphomicrobium methylovorum]|uniref:GumC family protein n=1 Tax=Hyphomicrobium methylovorum TaxID=84 RepID=UPI0015E7296F|nr:exopolysaccharide transport family protein [Hyphomicrobium methylovorum]